MCVALQRGRDGVKSRSLDGGSGHVVGASGFLTNRDKGSLCQRFCRPDAESQQFRHSVIIPDVQWAPREANSEADRLAEGCADGFDASLRITQYLSGCVPDDALAMGEGAENEKSGEQGAATTSRGEAPS